MKESSALTQYRIVKGQEILPYKEAVADVGLAVFREYPYFFEGTVSEYLDYLLMGANSKHSLFVIAEQDNQVIGVIWGVPVVDYTLDMIHMFSTHGIEPSKLFYLSGLTVLRDYRGRDVGYILYRKFENEVKKQGIYPLLTYCEVIQSSDRASPIDYVGLDSYASRIGFVKHPELMCYWSWREVDSLQIKEHPMVFWIKNLY